jgi:PadR family transcriptional regulator, regulatory protein PadR
VDKGLEVGKRTLDLMIGRALAIEKFHRLEMSGRIRQITEETFQVNAGSLSPVLHRLEKAGWLASSWGESENERKAKFD